MTLRILPLLLLAGCQLSMRAPAFSSTSSSSSQPRSTHYTTPDVRGMSEEAATAALRRAGHTGRIERDRNSNCSSVHERKIIELGHVCEQIPMAGVPMNTRLTVHLRVQHQDPRHGGSGRQEWRLMPDVVGMPVARARQLIAEAGFDDALTDVAPRFTPGCTTGTVCRQYPSALQRSIEHSQRVLIVGADADDAGTPVAN
jgi:beta-lactam-binding protein with PASTA domain